MTYEGVEFRSTLEADWAATLDSWGIHAWSYEPWAVRFDNGTRYLADFYLRALNTWAEVKGPHNERIAKPRMLHEALEEDLLERFAPTLVVVLRPSERGCAIWEGVTPDQTILLRNCSGCDHWSFYDAAGDWRCRICRQESKPALDYRPGEVPFERAPRPGTGA